MDGLLIVDDEEGIRRSVQAALRRERYRVSMAENGQAAVDIIEKDPGAVAVVISDFKMPGMNGIETLAAIGDLNPEICRIMLTGYATLDGAIEATNEGIDGFLTKPFDNNDLRQKVREYVVKKSLKRDVPDQVMQEVQDEPDSMVARRQQISVLYTNIAGFSQVLAALEPDELAALLGEYYFNPVSDIALLYKGTVDQYIGDSVVVLFGAPVARPDDARQAVFAALDMQERMQLINGELANQGKPQLPLTVSIATCEAVVGMFGSTRKRTYGALGSTVSIAAALEERAGAGQILIDQATYEAVRDSVRAEEVEPLAVKGAAISAYQVTGTLRNLR